MVSLVRGRAKGHSSDPKKLQWRASKHVTDTPVASPASLGGRLATGCDQMVSHSVKSVWISKHAILHYPFGIQSPGHECQCGAFIRSSR